MPPSVESPAHAVELLRRARRAPPRRRHRGPGHRHGGDRGPDAGRHDLRHRQGHRRRPGRVVRAALGRRRAGLGGPPRTPRPRRTPMDRHRRLDRRHAGPHVRQAVGVVARRGGAARRVAARRGGGRDDRAARRPSRCVADQYAGTRGGGVPRSPHRPPHRRSRRRRATPVDGDRPRARLRPDRQVLPAGQGGAGPDRGRPLPGASVSAWSSTTSTSRRAGRSTSC